MGMFANQPAPSQGGGANWQRIAGIVGDALSGAAGQPGQYAQSQYRGRQQQDELSRQLALEQYKRQNPEQPDVIRAMIAAGIDPRSARGQSIIQNDFNHPIVLGNAEQGQTVMSPGGAPTAGAGIDPAAIARLKANPGEAAMFDEHFGPGSAASVLGAQ